MKNQLTANFSLSELTASKIAVQKKIDNTPNNEAKENLTHLAKNLLQPLRDRYGEPLTINSGYRSTELNRAVGGVNPSQHLKGEAADVGCSNPKLLLTHLKNSRLSFDQAILYPTFLHLSLKRVGVNRKQIIIKMLLVFMLLTTSCAKPIYLQGKTEYIEKTILKDTTVYIHLPAIKQTTTTKDSSRLENQTAISIAQIDSTGILHHTLEQKKQEIAHKIEYREKIIIKRDSVPYPQYIKEIKEVKTIPKVFWITFWIALAAVGTAIFKISRRG